MTANNDSPAVSVLRRLIDAYDALQASDGAAVHFDEGTSRTFTVGAWLGQRMAADIDAARRIVAAIDNTPELPIIGWERCVICGNKQYYRDHAEIIDAGWIPEFWTSETTGDGPACPGCAEHRLTVDEESGEMVLKPKEDWTL